MAWAVNKFISGGWENVTETALYVVITAWDHPTDNGKIAEGTASGGDPVAPWTLKTIASANWALCKVPLAPEGGSFLQMGSFPELPAGDYAIWWFLQTGLTASKTADTFQRLSGVMPWDGEKPIGLANSMRLARAGDRYIDGADVEHWYDVDGTTEIATFNLTPPGGPYNRKSRL